jgi:hypothetical protein
MISWRGVRRRVFTWRREDATEATVKEGAPIVYLLTLFE